MIFSVFIVNKKENACDNWNWLKCYSIGNTETAQVPISLYSVYVAVKNLKDRVKNNRKLL